MARVSTYINCNNKTEEAFNFYKTVFGGEFLGGIYRFGDMPKQENMPELSLEDKKLVMHIELKILGDHLLMGTDAPESMGFKVIPGNNTYINLEPDSRTEADRLFKMLSAGGKVETPMQDMFWGGYYGSFEDKYQIHWMINCVVDTKG